MDKVIVIFLTDECHRKSSYFLEAIFTDRKSAIDYIVKHSNNSEGGKLDRHDQYLLETINQTPTSDVVTTSEVF